METVLGVMISIMGLVAFYLLIKLAVRTELSILLGRMMIILKEYNDEIKKRKQS